MAKFLLSCSLALAAIMATAPLALAETRAERNLRPAGDMRIPDLPAGHWATNATQVVIANNVLTLDNGAFQGDRLLSADELNQALATLASTAEAIASKGTIPELRASLRHATEADEPITRLKVAQALAPFLNACANDELVAIAAANHDASRFKDVGAAVPQSVTTVVDKYKVMTGYPDNTFRPDVAVSRYQMAAIAFNVLNTMRTAPAAQREVGAPNTIIVMQPPNADPTVVVVPAGPTSRPNYRERATIHVAWQAVNFDNISKGTPFATIPIEATVTGYNGPLMLQNVTDIKITPFTSNMVDSEFRLGYAGLKHGKWQALPFIGAHLAAGASQAPGDIQYDSYVGAAYGGIVSYLASDVLELSAHASQVQLLSAGRFSGAFEPRAYPNALGSVLTNYGAAADFYIARNICLTLGISTWQNPASLRTGNQTNALGIVDTFGLNLGVGSSF